MIARSASLPLLLSRYKPVVVVILALAAGVAGGFLAHWPLHTLAGVSLIILAVVLLSWPKTATLMVLFILYSNMAVVAVRFHDVPFIIGAAFPLLLALPLFSYLILERRPLRVTPALPAVLAFLVVQQISMLFSRDPASALSEVITTLTEGFLIYFLLINVVRTPSMLRYAGWSLLLAGLVLAAAPIIQQLTGTYNNDFGGFGQLSRGTFRTGETTLSGDVRQVRFTGPIGEQNRFAQVMLLLVPLGWFMAHVERKTSLRLLALVLALVALAGMSLSFSRGVAVAFVLVLLALMVTRLLRPAHFLGIILGIAVIFAAFPQYTVRLVTIPSAADLLDEETGTSGVDGAIRGRVTEMLAAVLVFADHPIIGVGPGQFKFYSAEYGNRVGLRILTGTREAHSLYPGLAADYGILGFIAFMAACLIPIRVILRNRHKLAATNAGLNNLVLGFAFVMIAYLASGIFLHLAYIRYFWVVLALVDVSAYLSQQTAEPGRETSPLSFLRRGGQQPPQVEGEAG
jgi:putative inorganic carbon (hco3(-)) transporter